LSIVLCLVFGALEPRFLSGENFINIFRQASIMGILAIGLTFVVVAGEIDMSFGANSSLAAVLSLILVIKQVNVVLIWAIILVVALVVGYINSIIVLRLKVPALLGTIGSWLTIGGIVAWMANGATVWTSKYPPIFEVLGRGRVLGVIPVPVVTLIVVSFLGVMFLEHTVLGRYFYAVGGNANAATHAGISTHRVKTTAFLFMGLLAGIAGLTMSSMFSSATPTVGQQFFFTAIIAVYLGSIFLKDGVPNLWGTVVASLFLAIISNGFNMIGLMYWHEQTAQGVLMIIAISMITFVSRKNVNIKV
ncbi:MAG: ABC transporter permease, partial [Planctomycetes bacterium]|nr:ABC transporter permease [Planctomycetota bacterium]